MKVPRALPILLALALLLSQHAGQAHALSHLDPGNASKEGFAHTLLCAKCASFDNLSLMLPASAVIAVDEPCSPRFVGTAVYRFVLPTITAFHSRAPPHLG